MAKSCEPVVIFFISDDEEKYGWLARPYWLMLQASLAKPDNCKYRQFYTYKCMVDCRGQPESSHRKMKEEDMSVSLSRNRQKCCKLTVLCAYKSYEHLTLSAVAATAFARPVSNLSKRRISLVPFVSKVSSPLSTINGCSVHSTSLAFGVYSRKVGVVGLTS